MALLLFYWYPHSSYQEKGFLSISLQSLFFAQFPLWFTPFYSLYGKLHVLSIWDMPSYDYLYLNCRHLIKELTFLVLAIGFLLIYRSSLTLVLCVLFFRVAIILISRWAFDDFGTFLLKRLYTQLWSFCFSKRGVLASSLVLCFTQKNNQVFRHGIHTTHEYN